MSDVCLLPWEDSVDTGETPCHVTREVALHIHATREVALHTFLCSLAPSLTSDVGVACWKELLV